MTATNPKVDAYIERTPQWRDALVALRRIVLDCGLREELKWGVPCYAVASGNVVLIHVFKAYCALLFFKGALLADRNGILIQQTRNVQAARQIRFSTAGEVGLLNSVVRAYVLEAMAVEAAGLQVAFKAAPDPVPEELQRRLVADPDLARAFGALTPGRQRGYVLHFTAPKQARTREARVEKCLPRILAGKGLEDE